MKHHVAIGLGGNIGDSEKIFAEAVECLKQGGLSSVRMASIIVTPAIDCVPGTPDFRNSAVVGDWEGTPLDLLKLTQSIEQSMGRPLCHSSRESRPLDLDILLMDGLCVSEPTLTIPHPRMCGRRFALEPLAQLEPDWIVPGVNLSVLECLKRLESKERMEN